MSDFEKETRKELDPQQAYVDYLEKSLELQLKQSTAYSQSLQKWWEVTSPGAPKNSSAVNGNAGDPVYRTSSFFFNVFQANRNLWDVVMDPKKAVTNVWKLPELAATLTRATSKGNVTAKRAWLKKMELIVQLVLPIVTVLLYFFWYKPAQEAKLLAKLKASTSAEAVQAKQQSLADSFDKGEKALLGLGLDRDVVHPVAVAEHLEAGTALALQTPKTQESLSIIPLVVGTGASDAPDHYKPVLEVDRRRYLQTLGKARDHQAGIVANTAVVHEVQSGYR